MSGYRGDRKHIEDWHFRRYRARNVWSGICYPTDDDGNAAFLGPTRLNGRIQDPQ